MALLKIISAFILIFVLSGCGDRKDERVSKGHRDAIKIQCEDASNIKACGLEVRENFIEDGNEYADFSELNDDQIDVVKFECVRSKKFGLVAYNNCLEKHIDKALGGTLFAEKKKKPVNNIEKLEESTVYIARAIVNLSKDPPEEYDFTSGSGIIISKTEIATNCHVAMAEPETKSLKLLEEEKNWNLNDNIKLATWIKLINGKDWALAELTKQNVKKDICIIKYTPKEAFKVSMKPINKFVPFEKLRKGDFVRAMGSPSGLIGYTSTGDIQWLGNAEGLRYTLSNIDEFDKDTKFIIHGAKIDQGSSGGPLFDADGGIIGLNTMISDSAAENIAVSADHIKDLLYGN